MILDVEEPEMKIQLKRNTLDLSVIIPSLNEGPNLYRLIPLIRDALNSIGMTWEIIIVDGNSPDGTGKIVADAGARYICEKAPGYGRAIMRGVAEANGAYLLTMDADHSHPANFIQSLWLAREKAEITIASRYVHGGCADQPQGRYLLSRILNNFYRVGLSIPVKDLSSGYRLYSKQVFAGLDLEFTNFVILIEILLKAYGMGLKIAEVPFYYKPRTSGSSKARIIRFGKDYLGLFYRIWKIRNSIQFPDYDWRAYDSRIPLQRYWQHKRHEIIMRYTPPYVSTCDVGCGSSHILADLPHAVGVDLRHDKLAFMRRTNDQLVQSSGLALPFPDGSFDCVLCSQVIEHIPQENGQLLVELTRILSPGGILILGTPDYDRWEWNWIEWLYSKVQPGAYGNEHVTHYSFKTLESSLNALGYELLEHDYICRGELILKARKK